jgi:hypothetical protein
MKDIFEIPDSLLTKLFDTTGSSTGGNKGFIVCYVNSAGEPIVVTKCETACVNMALQSALEKWLDSID